MFYQISFTEMFSIAFNKLRLFAKICETRLEFRSILKFALQKQNKKISIYFEILWKSLRLKATVSPRNIAVLNLSSKMSASASNTAPSTPLLRVKRRRSQSPGTSILYKAELFINSSIFRIPMTLSDLTLNPSFYHFQLELLFYTCPPRRNARTTTTPLLHLRKLCLDSLLL